MNKKNVYELGFLVDPNLSQQEAENSVEKIKKILADNGASVMSDGEVVNIELAYQIITKINSKKEKFNEAYFSWIKFSSEDTNKIEDIKLELDKIKKEIFRYLVIKTIEDNEATNKFKVVEEEKEETRNEEVKKEIKKSEEIKK